MTQRPPSQRRPVPRQGMGAPRYLGTQSLRTVMWRGDTLRGTARGPNNHDGRRAPPVRPDVLLHSVAYFLVTEKRQHGMALLGGHGLITIHTCSYRSESYLTPWSRWVPWRGLSCPLLLPPARTASSEGRSFRPHLSADTLSDPNRVGGRAGRKSLLHLRFFDSRGSDTSLAQPWGPTRRNRAPCSAWGLAGILLDISDPRVGRYVVSP